MHIAEKRAESLESISFVVLGNGVVACWLSSIDVRTAYTSGRRCGFHRGKAQRITTDDLNLRQQRSTSSATVVERTSQL